MTGPDYNPNDDEDGPEVFRPMPHPDDRLWRHPSEIAAMHAAHANADTAKVPVIQIAAAPRSRKHLGLMLAAGVVVVGAAALTIGVVTSTGTSTHTQLASQVVDIVSNNNSAAESVTAPSAANTQVVVETSQEGEEFLTARVHEEIAASLPRIQAATATGMREGSGFFVTDDGHIATSAGLIEDADYIIAWTDDGQRWKAHVVASDGVSDVAVLQIDSEDWPSVSLGSADDLRAGQYALALDHDEHQIAIGEVTTVSGPLIGVDQPAAVPGSAIVDDTGTVIAMLTNDGTNRNATPAWMLEQVAVDLISFGSTTHTWLGVLVENIDGDDTMIRVGEVVADSPAHKAGLRPGDLIDSMNGSPIPDAGALYRQVQRAEPGDEAVLTVTRNDSRRIIIATLTALDQQQ